MQAKMNKPGRRGLPRLIDATRYSFRGLRAAWMHEEGFRTECLLMLFLTPAAIWLAQDAVEFILLVGSCLLVMLAEIINSAIEAAIDRIGMDRHPLSGQAKDIGSAAVMMSLALCLTTWALVITERLTG